MSYWFIICLLAALGVAAWCPETPAGKVCRLWLIEAPARLLDRLSVKTIIGWVVFCFALIAIAQALPIELAMLGALDASAFTELMIAAGLVAANLRVHQVLQRSRIAARTFAGRIWSRSRVARRPHSRASAVRRVKLRPPPAEDDGGPVFAFA
jgi:hypothetical protein